MVKFYIKNLAAVAEIAGNTHPIGFLDLTDEEYTCLGTISETSVEMNINEKCILMHNGKFNIKRIHEREKASDENQNHFAAMFDQLNLQRVQFSRKEPFLAKYQNDIYFVGKRLYKEYLLLLSRTQKQPGIAIRINKKRLFVDRVNQILDVKLAIDFIKANQLCIIADRAESNAVSVDDHHAGYRRFIMSNNSWTLLEVEPTLIHASHHDTCPEIYAEIDFPFTNAAPQTNDEVQSQSEKMSRKESRKERKRERALKYEEKLRQMHEEKKQKDTQKR